MHLIKDDTRLANEVIKTLLYFDIFSYPLTSSEIYTYLQVSAGTPALLEASLQELINSHQIFKTGDLYSLHPGKRNIERRLKGNKEAEKWLEVARRQGRFIAHFPYVRAVMASGSLSKGYMDENSDLDFFIVTEPNRLWIARTLLVLYKRIFLFNSHKHFCVNYFVDTAHLEIEEQNLYTAIEIVTLIPLDNPQYYHLMLSSNAWLAKFLPNFRAMDQDTGEQHRRRIRTLLECLLNPFAKHLDRLFMRMSLRRWRKLYGRKYEKEDFDIAFKTQRHASKNHPNNYQRKILDLYQLKVAEYRRAPESHDYE